jgi:hypothetical protein
MTIAKAAFESTRGAAAAPFAAGRTRDDFTELLRVLRVVVDMFYFDG